MSHENKKAELAALRAKRKLALAEAEVTLAAEEVALNAEIEAERRALRVEENAAIIARHAPNASRAFFDFDPECYQPATFERDGKTFVLYTRFVVKGANADMLEAHSDAITAQIDAQTQVITPIIDLGKQTAIVSKHAIDCIVWPTAAECGVSPYTHRANLEASLFELGSARVELGKAAIGLGTKGAQARNSKS